jgi:hypothetical protein
MWAGGTGNPSPHPRALGRFNGLMSVKILGQLGCTYPSGAQLPSFWTLIVLPFHSLSVFFELSYPWQQWASSLGLPLFPSFFTSLYCEVSFGVLLPKCSKTSSHLMLLLPSSPYMGGGVGGGPCRSWWHLGIYWSQCFWPLLTWGIPDCDAVLLRNDNTRVCCVVVLGWKGVSNGFTTCLQGHHQPGRAIGNLGSDISLPFLPCLLFSPALPITSMGTPQTSSPS